jgi:hypothetical protein
MMVGYDYSTYGEFFRGVNNTQYIG